MKNASTEAWGGAESRAPFGRAIVAVLDQGDRLVMIFDDNSQIVIRVFEDTFRIVAS
jgi:hypothetical protein